uniref:Uncharacterized protein n=1 Tax=Osmundaria fimbriata TaxID=228265 RepID=A0A1Z1M4Q2_OSMFI|nr:hypothetical protein [Osmundaria fimbriata]ARW60823.1 hypothetical protein [Osmundaria fimbriata]
MNTIYNKLTKYIILDNNYLYIIIIILKPKKNFN